MGSADGRGIAGADHRCFGCGDPIPVGDVEWIPGKGDRDRRPFCGRCADELRGPPEIRMGQHQTIGTPHLQGLAVVAFATLAAVPLLMIPFTDVDVGTALVAFAFVVAVTAFVVVVVPDDE